MAQPSEETLRGLAGVMAGAMDPQFEQRASEIRAARTQLCSICGQVHFVKERPTCEGCAALLADGQTALVDAQNRFAFVEFPEEGDNADLRGKIEPVQSRVLDTVFAHAAAGQD